MARQPEIVRTCAYPGDGTERLGGFVVHFDDGECLAFVWHVVGGLAVLDPRGVWMHGASPEQVALLDALPPGRAWRKQMERLAAEGREQ